MLYVAHCMRDGIQIRGGGGVRARLPMMSQDVDMERHRWKTLIYDLKTKKRNIHRSSTSAFQTNINIYTRFTGA